MWDRGWSGSGLDRELGLELGVLLWSRWCGCVAVWLRSWLWAALSRALERSPQAVGDRASRVQARSDDRDEGLCSSAKALSAKYRSIRRICESTTTARGT